MILFDLAVFVGEPRMREYAAQERHWRMGSGESIWGRKVSLILGCAGHRPRQLAWKVKGDELARYWSIGKILSTRTDRLQSPKHLGLRLLAQLQAQNFASARYHEYLPNCPANDRGGWVRWVVGEVGGACGVVVGLVFREERRILTLCSGQGPPVFDLNFGLCCLLVLGVADGIVESRTNSTGPTHGYLRGKHPENRTAFAPLQNTF